MRHFTKVILIVATGISLLPLALHFYGRRKTSPSLGARASVPPIATFPHRASPEDRLIRPGDVLDMTLRNLMGHGELQPAQAEVDEDGFIKLIAAGRTKVAGLTLDGAARAIVNAAFEHQFILTVTVRLGRTGDDWMRLPQPASGPT